MYSYELKIVETKKGEEDKEVITIFGKSSRTLKSACQNIRRELLPYVSKNKTKE